MARSSIISLHAASDISVGTKTVAPVMFKAAVTDL
jgi:hypothetical protein